MDTVYEKITELLFEGVKYRKHRRTRHPVTPEDETTDHPFLRTAKRLSATNPRRKSAPSNFPALRMSGGFNFKLSQEEKDKGITRDQAFRNRWDAMRKNRDAHRERMLGKQGVEATRAKRSDPGGRKNVVAGLEDIIAQHYGQEGKKQGKQKSTGDLGKQKRKD
jgi:hypothetical protein